MRNILENILLCCVLSLCCPILSSAQDGGYDEALDKYAYICDRCIEMRDRAKSGQSVSESSLRSLLKELASLRKTLSGASGEMSPAQLARFEEIKARYRSGIMSSAEDQAKRSGKNTAASVQRLAPLPVAAARRSLIPLPGAEPVEAQGSIPSKLHDTSTGSVSGGKGTISTVSGKSVASIGSAPGGNVYSQGLKFTALADAGIFPTPSFGVTAVVTWNGVGAYAGYRSDFRRNEYSYVCSSDGSTEYGRIWASGESRRSRTVATAGFAMFTSRRFGFRIGGGLTSYTCCWEDSEGQWAKVGDESFDGYAIDGGIFLTFKPLVLSFGVTSDFSGHADLQFGVGVRF